MSNTIRITVIVFAALAQMLPLSAAVAYAYVGPGPGLTVIGALWAVIAAVLLAVLAIVRWPLRYLLRRLKGNKDPVNIPQAHSGDETKSEREETGDEG